MDKDIKKIKVDVDEDKLEKDLGRYVEAALEMGASRAKVISVENIPVDERVVMKCRVPRCFGYGVSMNCPPHAPTPAEIREYLKSYRRAVFFIKEVPSEVIVRDKSTTQTDFYKIRVGYPVFPPPDIVTFLKKVTKNNARFSGNRRQECRRHASNLKPFLPRPALLAPACIFQLNKPTFKDFFVSQGHEFLTFDNRGLQTRATDFLKICTFLFVGQTVVGQFENKNLDWIRYRAIILV
jgi:hypothetical protein